jgi:molybdenum cofactor cytidylyltransferase
MFVAAVTAETPPDQLPAEGVLCHDVRNTAQRSEVLLRKGRRLTAADLADLIRRGAQEMHVAVPAVEDVAEDEAAARLASAIAGEGVSLEPAHYGQVTMRSAVRGLLRVDCGRLTRINQQAGVLALTNEADCAADVDAPLGVVKCAPLFLGASVLAAVEQVGTAVSVEVFRPRRVAFVAVDERLRGGAFERAVGGLENALQWFGSAFADVVRAEATVPGVASAYRQAQAGGADLIMAATASATDPLDVMFSGLRAAGGSVLQTGIPAEPGTACWFGELDNCEVLGLASCELFGRPGALDLILPRLHAGERLDAELMQRIAVGGLLLGGPSRILPYHPTHES